MSDRKDARLGFRLSRRGIRRHVLVPRYYDPEIEADLELYAKTHQVVEVGALIDAGNLSVAAGHEVGKMAYGTGEIPFVRTSDIANWEIKTDPKQGVNEAIYRAYASRQDVQAADVLLVRDGTYLIGSAGLVHEADLPLLYQSHILRLRVAAKSPISPEVLVASFSTPIVQRQVRAKQFTADIIDTLGERYREIKLVLPKEVRQLEEVQRQLREMAAARVAHRETLRKVPLFVEGVLQTLEGAESEPRRERPSETLLGTVRKRSQVVGSIYVPRYYNPRLEKRLKTLSRTHDLVAIGELRNRGLLSMDTGIEVGKMAYGTGNIPFIRTSDLSNWELKSDPKQLVSEALLDVHRGSADVQPGDILFVRDGTYLVGTSAVVMPGETEMLYAGGLYKIRSADHNELDPYFLISLLNTPVVRWQVKTKQFTRDVIDTLGWRLLELRLPIPKDELIRQQATEAARLALTERARLRRESLSVALRLVDRSNDTAHVGSIPA